MKRSQVGVQIVYIQARQATCINRKGKITLLNLPSEEVALKVQKWMDARKARDNAKSLNTADVEKIPVIQEWLPELTSGQRELLMTGIDEQEWDDLFRSL